MLSLSKLHVSPQSLLKRAMAKLHSGQVSSVRRASVSLVVALLVAGGVAAPHAYAQSLKDKVAREGKLRIGVYNSNPVSFQTADGGVSGIYPDVMKEVATSLGVKNVDFEVMDFSALIPSLVSGRIDVIAAGMYITPTRCKQVSFSDPIGGQVGNGILVKKGNPANIHSYQDIAKNPALRVGDIRGAASVEYLTAAGIPKDRVQLYPDQSAGLAAMLADRIDVFVHIGANLVAMLRDPNVKGLERALPFKEIVNGQEMIHYTGFAFRPQDAEMRDTVNKVLAQKHADGTVEKIFQKYGFGKEDSTRTDATTKSVCGENYR